MTIVPENDLKSDLKLVSKIDMMIVPGIDMRIVSKIDLRTVPNIDLNIVPKIRCERPPRVDAVLGDSLGQARKLAVDFNDVLLHGVVLRLACRNAGQ